MCGVYEHTYEVQWKTLWMLEPQGKKYYCVGYTNDTIRNLERYPKTNVRWVFALLIYGQPRLYIIMTKKNTHTRFLYLDF